MYKRTMVALVVGLLSASPSMADSMMASWYGSDGKHGFPSDHMLGNHMAMPGSGRLSQYAHTAAHKTLPFGTKLLLVNSQGRTACVTITDRGPYIKGRQLDVTYTVAVHLGITRPGSKRLTVVRGGC